MLASEVYKEDQMGTYIGLMKVLSANPGNEIHAQCKHDSKSKDNTIRDTFRQGWNERSCIHLESSSSIDTIKSKLPGMMNRHIGEYISK